LHVHLATAARVKYPAACCVASLMPRQLVAGYLTETTAGKGCYVSVRNQDFYLEEQQKKIESCFNDAIEIARMSGIPLDKLVSLLTLLYEEENPLLLQGRMPCRLGRHFLTENQED
jgi:hypothetical protein